MHYIKCFCISCDTAFYIVRYQIISAVVLRAKTSKLQARISKLGLERENCPFFVSFFIHFNLFS